LLDYWVARASDLPNPRVDDGLCWIEVPPCDGKGSGAAEAAYSPTSDWEHAGPLIEALQISIERANMVPGEPLKYYARAGTGAYRTRSMFGPTHLVAAMRAVVNRKFGDTVPDDGPTAG
jgi:hypothetical protein